LNGNIKHMGIPCLETQIVANGFGGIAAKGNKQNRQQRNGPQYAMKHSGPPTGTRQTLFAIVPLKYKLEPDYVAIPVEVACSWAW
jgi:hypothetical protein